MPAAAEPSAPLVRARGVSKVHHVGSSDVRALDAVNLNVARGEFLSVVGVSGSGKSTLLHVLGGLDAPTAGRIDVDGRALGEMTPHERSIYRRTIVGFVFQQFHLVPSLDAAGNVELALLFQGRPRAERRKLALESLERVGLAKRAMHRPGELSGGEQQRVAIARALVHRPPLLLADEPTGNLDRATAAVVMEVIGAARSDLGSTVVMVTHDEATAARVSTRVVRLVDGRFSSDGSAA